MESAEAIDYEDFVARVQPKKKDLWKLSEPIGGRMINSDPVFTADEKYVACYHFQLCC